MESLLCKSCWGLHCLERSLHSLLLTGWGASPGSVLLFKDVLAAGFRVWGERAHAASAECWEPLLSCWELGASCLTFGGKYQGWEMLVLLPWD